MHKQTLMLIHLQATLSDEGSSAAKLERLGCPLVADCGQSTSPTSLQPNYKLNSAASL